MIASRANSTHSGKNENVALAADGHDADRSAASSSPHSSAEKSTQGTENIALHLLQTAAQEAAISCWPDQLLRLQTRQRQSYQTPTVWLWQLRGADVHDLEAGEECAVRTIWEWGLGFRV